MRFKSKTMPTNGTIEIRRGFLWLPLTIKGETRWLERARWSEECVHLLSVDGYLDSYEWLPIEWKD